MMNKVYPSNYIELLKKKKTMPIVVIVSSLLLVSGIDIALLFVTNENNKVLMSIILSVIFVIGLWVSIYFLINGLLFSNRKAAFISQILKSDYQELKGAIEEVGNVFTLNKGLRCFEITFVDDNGVIHKLYLDEELNAVFKNNQKVKIKVSKNFIIEYEVLKDEKE